MRSKIIAVANQKGGVGKTTTCINLAACLTALKKRVLVIDMDPQANATSGLGLEKTEGMSLYDVLLGEAQIADKITPTAFQRLDMVTGEVDLAGAEVDVARRDHYLHRVREVLEPFAETGRYDYIFLDCPPSLGILTMNALTAADCVLIPIQCEYYALEGLSVIINLVNRLRENGSNDALQLDGIVMTMYDSRTNLSQQVVEEVSLHLADKIYETMIPRTVRLGEAPSHGLPIIAYDRNSTGAEAYKMLAREFLRRQKSSIMEAAKNSTATEDRALSEPASQEEIPQNRQHEIPES